MKSIYLLPETWRQLKSPLMVCRANSNEIKAAAISFPRIFHTPNRVKQASERERERGRQKGLLKIKLRIRTVAAAVNAATSTRVCVDSIVKCINWIMRSMCSVNSGRYRVARSPCLRFKFIELPSNRKARHINHYFITLSISLRLARKFTKISLALYIYVCGVYFLWAIVCLLASAFNQSYLIAVKRNANECI